MASFFDTRIEFLKGIGPQKAALLNTELGIFTYSDLIQHYPFRYEDRSHFWKIREIHEELPYVQLKGTFRHLEMVGVGPKKRLVGRFHDDSGMIEMVWFQGAKWIVSKLKTGVEYVVYGKPTLYGRNFNIAHPEVEPLSEASLSKGLQPVYPTTEKLKAKFMDSKAINKAMAMLMEQAMPHIQETLPDDLLNEYKLMSKKEAMKYIHFPSAKNALDKAIARLKFEELFYIQFKLLRQRALRRVEFEGMILKNIPTLNEFYKNHLPFDLTNAQKRVIREIYKDVCSGKQMNRLLQGDVGSGKTIVAFICMLMALDNGAQACLMAPTEILSDQHYKGLKELADKLGLNIRKLTGSTKTKERREIHEQLEDGSLHIIVGTHALLEEKVKFKNLGLVVIDEQHRFGVAQRAKLWSKNAHIPPHILVMTATPIPRTLAMTLYGDLDLSVIDELPAGRKPIQTIHQYEKNRLKVLGFVRDQISKGRQIYIVYPLIEESEKMDLKNLTDGYQALSEYFKEYKVDLLHGRMTPENKDIAMAAFVKGETNVLVATTVIEVGVNVPNASVMVIENSERFGLSQLHQLRGRVGRGAEQSYCILMSEYKLSKDSRFRLDTMVKTNNGFEIADADLKLRGPGDMAGTQQSGILELKLANLAEDSNTLQVARIAAMNILDKDPELEMREHYSIKRQLEALPKNATNWSRIS